MFIKKVECPPQGFGHSWTENRTTINIYKMVLFIGQEPDIALRIRVFKLNNKITKSNKHVFI